MLTRIYKKSSSDWSSRSTNIRRVMRCTNNDQHHRHSKLMIWLSHLFILALTISVVNCQNEYFDENSNIWTTDVHDSSQSHHFASNNAISTRLTSLDVICGKESMTVRAEFNAPFKGIVFSKGTYGQSKCVYVKPRSGLTHVTFNVRYDECGTKPDLQGKYFENTIVIQYGTDIIEALDEAKRLRCEWFEAYEKPATFRPAIPVADLDIIEMNFQGDEIDCWMSIQEGKGPLSNEINRIVTVGQPLTIVVAINDNKNQFDMKVKSCFAHDGVKAPIYLIDEEGCVLRPKMISPFKKLRNVNGKASLISYAQFLAFKFPDSVDVQIQCTVEVCRHGCTDSCGGGSDRSSNDVPTMRPEETIYKNVNVKLPTKNEYTGMSIKDADLIESANNFQEVAFKEPEVNYGQRVAHTDRLNPDQIKDIISTTETITERNYLNDIASFLQTVDSTLPPVRLNQSKIYEPPRDESKIPYDDMMPGNLMNQFDSFKLNVPYSNMNRMPAHSILPKKPYYHQEPVAQVMNIPLNPLFIAPMATMRPHSTPNMKSILNPFNNIKLFNKKQTLPNLFSSYFGKNRRSQYVPNDNFEIFNQHMPAHRHFVRTKREIKDKQGEVGLKRGFQVVTSLDLSFSPSASGDQMPVYEGKPAPIIYGICFTTTHFFFFISLLLSLLLIGISTCVYIIVKIEKRKAPTDFETKCNN